MAGASVVRLGPVGIDDGLALPRCRVCGTILAFKADGRIKLRTRLIAFDEATGAAEMSCPCCKSDTPVQGVFIRVRKATT